MFYGELSCQKYREHKKTTAKKTTAKNYFEKLLTPAYDPMKECNL